MLDTNTEVKPETKKEEDWVDEPAKAAKPTKERKEVVKTEKKASKPKAKPKAAKKQAAKAKPKSKVKSHPILKGGKKTRKRAKAVKKDANAKITVNFKVLPSQFKPIKAKARKLTNGNVTQMVIKAVAAWKPSKKELKSLEDTRKTTRA